MRAPSLRGAALVGRHSGGWLRERAIEWLASRLRRQQRSAVGVVHRAAPLPAGLLAKHIGSAPGLVDPPLPARVAQPGLHDHQGIVCPLDHLHGLLSHLKLTVKVIGDGSEGAADGGNARTTMPGLTTRAASSA